MRRLSASYLHLADAGCLAWLRDDVEHAQKTAYPIGTAAHAMFSVAMNDGVCSLDTCHRLCDEAGITRRARRTRESAMFEAQSYEGWWRASGRDMRSEVAYAYDPVTDTARELPRASHRDYSAAVGLEVVGTADVVTVAGDAVYDLKSWIRDVKVIPQLETLALMVARTHDRDEVHAAAVRAADGPAMEIPYGFDAVTLDARASKLRVYAERIEAGDLGPQPGEHCHRCPARGTCEVSTWAKKGRAA